MIATDRNVQQMQVAYHSWQTFAIIVGLAWIVVLGLFWDTGVSMVATWYHSRTFAHGFLILPLSLYLIWRRRQRLASLLAPNLWGLLLLAGLGWGWLLGNLADVLVIQQFALVGMLQGLVWTVGGTRVTSTLLFPLAFLWFAVPIGAVLVPILQDFTVLFTVQALRLSGIPVFWEGRFLTVPSGMWHVAEACSGLRYLIAAVAFGCLYAFVTYRSRGRRMGFVLASVVVPILANGARVYGIILLAHLGNSAIAKGSVHRVYGGIFFVVVMALLAWCGSRWREPATHTSPAMDHDRGRVGSPRTLALAAACGVVVLALAQLVTSHLASPPEISVVVQAAAPDVTPPWQELAEATGNWVPRFAGADAEVMQSYTAGRQPVHLYIAYYASQRRGAELINSQNTLVDRQRWQRIAQGHPHATVDGRTFPVRELAVQSSYGNRLVWSWYWVAGEYTANPYWAKLLQVKARLVGGTRSVAVIALGADYHDHRAEAAEVLQDFLRHSASLQVTLRSIAR